MTVRVKKTAEISLGPNNHVTFSFGPGGWKVRLLMLVDNDNASDSKAQAQAKNSFSVPAQDVKEFARQLTLALG